MDTKSILILIGIVVLVAFLSGAATTMSNNNYVIEGSTCMEDYECYDRTMDCIVHFAPSYEWNGDIECIGRLCICLSK